MKHRYLLISIVLTGLALLFTGCQDNPADSNLDPDTAVLSTPARQASQVAWQTISNVRTQEQFSAMIGGSDDFLNEDGELPATIAEVQQNTQLWRQLQNKAAKATPSAKSTGDSLIWFFEWSDSTNGTSGRQAVYYTQSTGIACAYEVIDGFPPQIKLEYDSTALQVFVGPSFDDESDDRLLNVDQLSLFESGYPVESVEVSVEATAWDVNNEVTAANASNTVVYGGQSELQKLIQTATMNEDQSGSYSERYEYRDNTTLLKSITFFSDSRGEFSETWRDGSIVNGTFDVLEDDNKASLTRSIQFANHPLVDRISHSADYSLDPSDSSSSALLVEKVYFKSGELDTARVQADRYLENGFWVEEVDIRTSDDGRTNFLVRHLDTHKEIEGDFEDAEGYYGRFNAIEYPAGNGELWLTIYASEQAYLNNEPPLVSLHIIYNGDGSGNGEITENGESYQLNFTADGEMIATNSDGDRETVNAYR